jgi:hypothetical protein
MWKKGSERKEAGSKQREAVSLEPNFIACRHVREETLSCTLTVRSVGLRGGKECIPRIPGMDQTVTDEGWVHSSCGVNHDDSKKKKNSVVLVRKRTIPTKPPQPADEVSANFS